MENRIIAKRVIPLVEVSPGKLLVYKNAKLGIFNVNDYNIKWVGKLNIGILRKILGYSSLACRRFGLNEIKAANVDREQVLINYHGKFYLLNLKNDNLIKEIKSDSTWGKRVLSMSSTSHGIIMGEYGYNPEKNPMRIFIYDKNSHEIKTLYTFPKGYINHIHNIVEDKITGRIWILTGDFGDSAAIYYTDDFFSTVKCSIRGDQSCRACLGISKNNILYYVTDSPLVVNNICKLEDGKIKKLYEVNGSCIYGVNLDNKMIFSTTVENQTNELNNNKNRYKYNLGKGIKDWYVEIIEYDIEKNIKKIIIRNRKDILPMIPFQYGCYRFPQNRINSKYLFCYGQAIKKHGSYLVMFNIDK